MLTWIWDLQRLLRREGRLAQGLQAMVARSSYFQAQGRGESSDFSADNIGSSSLLQFGGDGKRQQRQI